jgi:hypothetical protein
MEKVLKSGLSPALCNKTATKFYNSSLSSGLDLSKIRILIYRPPDDLKGRMRFRIKVLV